MGQVKDAIRGVSTAARRGDLGGARDALTDLGQAIGRDRSLRQVVDRVQQAVSDVGGQVQQAISAATGQAGRVGGPMSFDAGTAAGIVPVCATLVQAGRLATEKGTTQAIRNLGERLAVQFDQIGSQLRELGRDVPQGPDEAGQRLITALSDLAGNLFDQAFLDESMNAVIRILDALPQQAGGLGTQLRQLAADLKQQGDTIHGRAATLPGEGTTVGIERDREAT
jgi:hypothetical protein